MPSSRTGSTCCPTRRVGSRSGGASRASTRRSTTSRRSARRTDGAEQPRQLLHLGVGQGGQRGQGGVPPLDAVGRGPPGRGQLEDAVALVVLRGAAAQQLAVG